MHRIFGILGILLLAPSFSHAQDTDADRVAFGSDVHVARGEIVRDAVSFGGDVIIDGVVRGDAVSFGGAVRLGPHARVEGDVSSFGGEVADGRPALDLHPPAEGPVDRLAAWVRDASQSAIAHVLLFLLGLLLIGSTRERLRAMQVTIVEDGLKTAGMGLLAYVAAAVAIVVLAISLVGIPVAVILALALPVATYVGLAAAATVVGAMLPIEQLRGREVAQLGAGVALLFVASLVPVAGTVVTAALACLGLGALVRTRFGTAPPEGVPHAAGPYRTPAET